MDCDRYKLSDQALDELMRCIQKKNAHKKVRVFFEPGHILSQQASYALGKILSIKEMYGHYYLTLDLSRKCHLKWSDPRCFSLEPPLQTEEYLEVAPTKIHFGSPTCFEHDHIQTLEMPVLNQVLPFKEGEIIVFSHVNGYSTAWNTAFNGIPKAKVLYLQPS